MSLIGLLVILIVLGAIAWLVNTKLPGNATIKLIINIVLIVVAIILVLQAFGIWGQIRGVQVPKL